MSKGESSFSGPLRCGHCGNIAPLEIRATVSQVKDHLDPRSGFQWDEGPIHELLVCPACAGIVLRRQYWHDVRDPSELPCDVLYPSVDEVPLGLPDLIRQEFEAALRVRSASPNAYGVLLGRLLELVCDDRGAKKGNLSARLKELSARGEIPQKLVEMAERLRALRNVGAHAWVGELTDAEIPILANLCRAILEYVYSAPYLVQQADRSLEEARRRERAKRKKPTEGGA
jgi:uncharacterized protein YbaR (Trm112 family)